MNAKIKYRMIAQKRQPHLNKMYAVYVALIKQVFDRVVSNLEQGNKTIPEAKSIAETMKPKVKAAYKGVITGGFRAGIEDCEEAYGKPLPVLVKKEVSDEDLMSLGMGNTIKKIEGQAMKQVTTISETLHDVLMTQFKQGTENNETLPQLTSRIRRCADDYPTWMAKRIAKTESTRAWNASTLEAYKQSSVAQEKEWVPYPLGKGHRSFHSGIANVPVDKPFKVMGEDLMYPGDPAGSPENVINCVCAMMPVIGRIQRRPVEQVPSQEAVSAPEVSIPKTFAEVSDKMKSNLPISYVDSLYYANKEDAVYKLNAISDSLINTVEKNPRLKQLIAEGRISKSTFTIVDQKSVLTNEHASGVYLKTSGGAEIRVTGQWRLSSARSPSLGKLHCSEGVDDVARHEFGHHLSYQLKTKEVTPISWGELYKGHDKKWWEKNVSKYSATDANEAFAEAFSTYTHPYYGVSGKTLPKDVERWFDFVLKGESVSTPVNVAAPTIGRTAVSAPKYLVPPETGNPYDLAMFGENNVKLNSTLDITEKEIIERKYLGSMESFRINEILRFPNEAGLTLPKHIRNSIDDYINSITSTINKSEVTSNIVSYRAMSKDMGLKVGDIFTDKGFVSTTLDSNHAYQFINGIETRGRLMEIRIPKGTNAYYAGVKEQELLLQRGTTFLKVGERVTVNGEVIDIMEVVSQ